MTLLGLTDANVSKDELLMDVNRISNVRVEAPSIDPVTRPRSLGSRTDDAAFDKTERVNKALSDLPDARSEEVDRAKGLVSSLKYPPDEIVAGIARLLTGPKRRSDQYDQSDQQS